MFSCCDLCYEKYIDLNNIIDMKLYNESLHKVKILWINEGHKGKAEFIEENKNKICTCPCHKIGQKILH